MGEIRRQCGHCGYYVEGKLNANCAHTGRTVGFMQTPCTHWLTRAERFAPNRVNEQRIHVSVAENEYRRQMREARKDKNYISTTTRNPNEHH